MECLPQMKKKHPETLAQLHVTFNEKLLTRLNEDMDELLTDLKLKEKLDFLDQLESDQAKLSTGEIVWYEKIKIPQYTATILLYFFLSP